VYRFGPPGFASERVEKGRKVLQAPRWPTLLLGQDRKARCDKMLPSGTTNGRASCPLRLTPKRRLHPGEETKHPLGPCATPAQRDIVASGLSWPTKSGLRLRGSNTKKKEERKAGTRHTPTLTKQTECTFRYVFGNTPPQVLAPV
jgi:hypothetical protein